MNPILVQSHVARDFLQGSAYFNTVPKVVWEYVSNSIDNPNGNQAVHCRVHIGGNQIVIQDDARGMSRDDLARFFTMHAENVERAAGRTVRGRFGTGKSAAFGLGSVLRVTSVKDGRRNAVELRRDDVVAAADGQPFTVRDLIVDEPTEEPSGTSIEIEGITTKAADVMATKMYIERRLGRYRGAHSVVINNHVAEFEEPQFIEERTFPCPPGPLTEGAEAVTLTVRISPTPLDETTNGVDILSRGIYHETTLAGRDRAEMHEYLFGFVDVPALEDDAGPIAAFDNTRSGRLNPANPLVTEVYSWIGSCLEEVRATLVERERERRRSAEAIRLSPDPPKPTAWPPDEARIGLR
ncbi:MAG: ATP-binding protein [Candidatus Limnocylindrales bacterium]